MRELDRYTERALEQDQRDIEDIDERATSELGWTSHGVWPAEWLKKVLTETYLLTINSLPQFSLCLKPWLLSYQKLVSTIAFLLSC
jgi:hypothetical protein